MSTYSPVLGLAFSVHSGWGELDETQWQQEFRPVTLAPTQLTELKMMPSPSIVCTAPSLAFGPPAHEGMRIEQVGIAVSAVPSQARCLP